MKNVSLSFTQRVSEVISHVQGSFRHETQVFKTHRDQTHPIIIQIHEAKAQVRMNNSSIRQAELQAKLDSIKKQ